MYHPSRHVKARGSDSGRLQVAAAAAALLVLCLQQPAHAWSPRLSQDDDIWIQVGLFTQLRYEALETLDEGGRAVRPDVYFRRARIMGMGSVHERVRFFLATDVPGTGRPGAPNTIIWNAAFVDFTIREELKIAMGRILAPFSLENRASSIRLLGIDYNLASIKVPTLIGRSAWRDDGVEARGVLFDGLIDYRVAVLHGERLDEQALQQEAATVVSAPRPRFTGMLLVNLADAQPGWFFDTNSLGQLDVLSFGAGIDFIPSRVEPRDSLALCAFVLVEQPVGWGRVNALVSVYRYAGTAWSGGFEGNTLGAQIGYLLPLELLGGQWQPVVRYQQQDLLAETSSQRTFNFGLNYLLKGHNLNLKLDYALNDRREDAADLDALRFQVQLYF